MCDSIKLFSLLSALIERDYRVIATTNNLSERYLDTQLIAIKNKLPFNWNLNRYYIFRCNKQYPFSIVIIKDNYFLLIQCEIMSQTEENVHN